MLNPAYIQSAVMINAGIASVSSHRMPSIAEVSGSHPLITGKLRSMSAPPARTEFTSPFSFWNITIARTATNTSPTS